MNHKELLLIEAVNTLLTKSAVPATLTIEQCAVALAMSMTSFRRKLRQEETTFKLIQQKYLNELCVHALLTKQVSIDNLVVKLGYSERATFERAFRNKFGVTPSQFRDLSLIGEQSNKQTLSSIAQNMSPLPDSCLQLLQEKEQDSLDVGRVVEIVASDPVFTGRVIGLASKAIYGKTPRNTQEAISRNLGINTVINMAVIYGVKDALESQVEQRVIEQSTHAFLIAPKFFQLMRKSVAKDIKFDSALTEQVLIFALLGILLLTHKNSAKHELILHSLQGINDLQSLNQHVNQAMNISIYSASTLMLSLWHIDASVIKQLNHLDKVSQQKIKGSKQDDLELFMLSCLYVLATRHSDFSELEEKSQLLGLENFTDIKALLFTEN
ncbi:helix-turn-helix domain-containing protein [Colwellia psychrerythraea]|uniref:Transcriptional regulator with only HTH domain, AraC family n=1 Tax=Colwellia psychrerythraea TaxID=28229 RepID=A0A099KKY2_COLPS|nr:helix-turn-helix domain-containing protein [Colwellia psychrerythraea]KGJ91454.1 transcriptional regulator with only HTH domain, AraC family [Colwellia psychrerythraea]